MVEPAGGSEEQSSMDVRLLIAAVWIVILLITAGVPHIGLATISHAKTPRRTTVSPPIPLPPAPGTGAFGLDLMRAQGPGNLVLSPDSVAAALAMTGMGGVGRTAEEIAQALHLKGPAELPAVGDLQRAIAAGQVAAAGGDPEAPTLRLPTVCFSSRGCRFASPSLPASSSALARPRRSLTSGATRRALSKRSTAG